MLEAYLARWNLETDGELIETRSSILLPVRLQGRPAMLKIAQVDEERRDNLLMRHWAGAGAAEVWAHADDAVLLERAMGTRSLVEMSHHGQDVEATRIICGVAAQLHAQAGPPTDTVVPLHVWFQSLWPAAERFGGLFDRAADTARSLLQSPRDLVTLHGDLHHGNVLDGGDRGWLAIDPKALLGERGFDFANLFCNPDADTATRPGRFTRQLDVVAEAASLDRHRLLQWVIAYAGLTAAWSLEDGDRPEPALTIAEQAAAELG